MIKSSLALFVEELSPKEMVPVLSAMLSEDSCSVRAMMAPARSQYPPANRCTPSEADHRGSPLLAVRSLRAETDISSTVIGSRMT
jgi:hypothetical protein